MDKRLKESKSVATIRRRTNRGVQFGNFFSCKQKTPAQDPFESDGQEDVSSEPDGNDSFQIYYLKIFQSIMSSQKKLFWSLMALRVLNALVIQTSYVPDEYWQSTEVAHNMVFGYGHLTWEWRQGIRSYAYPLIFAILYKFLAIFHLDSRFLVVKGPRLVQGIFAALGDLYVYRLSLRLSGVQVARWTLICQLTSWFIFYTSTRTLTNSMEAVLVSAVLYYFPWPGRPKKAQWKYLLLMCLAVIIRPTAAVILLPLFLWHVVMWRNLLWKVIKYSAERGLVVLLLSSIIDRIFYGKWVNIQYNFLQFNILSGLSGFYGTHPWHWYLTQGLPVVLATHLVFLLIAYRKRKEPVFLGVITWCIVVYSFLGHKEFRFLSGVLPLVMHVCGSTLNEVLAPSSELKGEPYKAKGHSRQGQTTKVIVVVILLVTNVPLALYFSLIHQRGTIDVMSYVYREAQKSQYRDNAPVILYLMPCHSTPYYSYVHKNITMSFLTCEPNLLQSSDNYIDEADQFYSDPVEWLNVRYIFDRDTNSSVTSSTSVPTHVIFFDELYTRIALWLRQHNFHICDRFFHTHLPEGRVSSYVVVACRSSLSPVKNQISLGSGLRNTSLDAVQGT